jgi:hypothetical protein
MRQDVDESSSESPSASTQEYSSSSDSETYEVEKILDHRVDRRGNRRFLVKWQGYPYSEKTWEPEKTLNCPDLLEAYLKHQKLAQKAIAPRGRLIEKPQKITGVWRDSDDEISYDAVYASGKTERLPSGDVFKLSPQVLVKFLEAQAQFKPGRPLDK